MFKNKVIYLPGTPGFRSNWSRIIVRSPLPHVPPLFFLCGSQKQLHHKATSFCGHRTAAYLVFMLPCSYLAGESLSDVSPRRTGRTFLKVSNKSLFLLFAYYTNNYCQGRSKYCLMGPTLRLYSVLQIILSLLN